MTWKRFAIAVLMPTSLLLHAHPPPKLPPPPENVRVARQFVSRVIREYPDALPDKVRLELNQSIAAFTKLDLELTAAVAQRPSLGEEEYRRRYSALEADYQKSVQRLTGIFDSAPGLLRIAGPSSFRREVAVAFDAMPVLLYKAGNGRLQFVWRKIDVTESVWPTVIELTGHGPVVGGIELVHAAARPKNVIVVLRTAGHRDVTMTLRAVPVPSADLTVDIRDENGTQTEVTAALYSEGKRLIVPETALNFGDGGEGYSNIQYLYNRTSRYWPGKGDYVRSFYQRGAFTVRVPAGKYRLIVAKGPEFEPVDREIEVVAGDNQTVQFNLRRWIDMRARGWYSGDCHVHYERKDPKVNAALELWSRAEDVHLASIMAMGDGRYTYYDQYAWGKAGRYIAHELALVPGQEDPRTNVLGHTLHMNLTAPIRFLPQSYYVYGDVFDESHRQGGISGYAHVNSSLFNVARDMSINIPLGKIDFVEICEAGNVKTSLYYEFLNLGYELIAAGGSDVPYYGSIGDSRTYVHVDGAFSADGWFENFLKGRTFITVGPMLEFTVDGNIAGTKINAERGATLHIKAKVEAGQGTRDPERLEIVVNGEVVKSVEAPSKSESIEFDLPVKESMWIAARATGAHTTPAYVTVDGKRHWNARLAPALIEKHLRTLDEIEALIGRPLPEGGRILWESNEAFARDAERLREAIGKARSEYKKLSAQLGSPALE